MKRKIKGLAVFTLSIIIVFGVTWKDACAQGASFGSALKFSAGFITSFAVHETSHALVGELTSTRMHWELGTYGQPLGFTEYGISDEKGLALNSAGLLSEVIGSEIFLQTERIDKNNDFVRGFMTRGILNTLSYSLDYWFFRVTNKREGNNYRGDIEGIEEYGGETAAQIFAVSMAAIAVFQGQRFLKTQSWAPDWLKGTSKSHKLKMGLTSSKDFVISYKFTF